VNIVSGLFQSKVKHTWYELSWPSDLDEKQVAEWLIALSGQPSSNEIRFSLLATTGKVRFFLIIPDSNELMHIRTLKTFLPDIEITKVEPIKIEPKLTTRVLMTSRKRTLQTKTPNITSHAIISSLSVLSPGEMVVINWKLGRVYSPQTVSNVPSYSSNWLVAILEAFIEQPRSLESNQIASYREKMSHPYWQANMFICVNADTFKRSLKLIRRVEGALRDSDAPGVRIGIRLTPNRKLDINFRNWFWSLRLNPQELTGLLGWPLGGNILPGITRIASKYLPIPNRLAVNGRVIASDLNSDLQLKQKTSDGLMHTHVIGPTGVGKTTLLLNLIFQDIALGNSVVVVDPKGDLVNGVLSRIPKEREKDVIVLDPADMTNPVGLNPLSSRNTSCYLAVDNILTIFRKLYADNFGPRTEDILHAGLLTLSKTPGMNISCLPVLLTNKSFRQSLISKINDPFGLGSFWDWFNGISEAERQTAIAPLMNKLRAFLMRPSMLNVLSQSEPKLEIEQVLSSDGILLVNLAKGTLGSETSQLFGSLVVSQVWQAIQARANLPQSKRTPGFVYIDEVQDYLHLPTDIGNFLAQSRSYGVGMVLANQYLSQLTPELKSAVMSNIRSRVTFQLGHSDAVEMAKTSNILKPSDFENLDTYNIYASIASNGSTQPWVSGKTLSPINRLSNPSYIRNLSRNYYGLPVNEINSRFRKLITDNSVSSESAKVGEKTTNGVQL
jgi:hypothetical protein